MRVSLVVSIFCALALAACDEQAGRDYTGSASCRTCHERFYQLWAPSHHGTAMQPYTSEFAAASLTSQDAPIQVGGTAFKADLERGAVVEGEGEGARQWPIAHVMGGKNVFYFLTPLDRGRLQVLPVAYDVRDRQWYDTTASMVRHAIGHTDTPVAWTDPLLTFNTSCWNCHVSQLSLNYDPETSTYRSEWAEPGINCETCHGPASEHVRVCQEAKEGEVPDDLKIIRTSVFTPDQLNDTCAPCHAKSIVLTRDFQPGDRYFDHFDLTCLEDLDFHPDGRDLGENYTFTLWRMSPCVVSGGLDCVHCHTSSGRYRFADTNPNGACLPCHEEHVDDVSEHSHHPADSAAGRCIACHMPMTEFARMVRSDHSMRPPAPALTKAFGSPNACNICHADRDADWADGHVRSWRERDYQAPMLEVAGWVAAARERDWKHLDEMLAYLRREDRDEVFATSLIRLLAACGDRRKFPALLTALEDPSPLVRAAAAAGLRPPPSREALRALLAATGDDARLVRVRAAGSLAGFPPGDLPAKEKANLARATEELVAALGVRPDSWSSHYNLGNYYEQCGDDERAKAKYEQALALRADVVMPWVNLSMLHARAGRVAEAEKTLRRALSIDPNCAEAHYNLGLLMAERERPEDAKRHLTKALASDPTLAAAAFNLAVLVAERDLERAIELTHRAWKLRPDQTRYAETLAFYLVKAEKIDTAVRVLNEVVKTGMPTPDVYAMLGSLYERQGQKSVARAVYLRASEDRRLPPQARQAFQQQAKRLE